MSVEIFDVSPVGALFAKLVGADDEDALLVRYSAAGYNGCDLLAKHDERGRWMFRLIYPRRSWGRARDLPPQLVAVAVKFLHRRRATRRRPHPSPDS